MVMALIRRTLEMTKLGVIGWRGMVGSVLLERFKYCKDLNFFDICLFSTTKRGRQEPFGQLMDSNNLAELSSMEIIVCCQGSEYTSKIHPALRAMGWEGYWIDASSFLRKREDVSLILDPLNKEHLEKQLKKGQKDFTGANCTVSLMLMALGGPFSCNLVEWVNCATYQAISGAGAAQLQDFFLQLECLKNLNHDLPPLMLEKKIRKIMLSSQFPQKSLGAPLVGNLLPWIDSEQGNGMSREEWKGQFETEKIIGRRVPVESTCIRVGAFRCHSQAITLKLKEDLSLEQFSSMIDSHNEWVKVIPNNKEDSLKYLNPISVTETLKIPVGRIRKLSFGPGHFSLFTLGDQLLWGAAEPLRRMCHIILDFKKV
jgi:aspartate-semialdehyde dehydrogenase